MKTGDGPDGSGGSSRPGATRGRVLVLSGPSAVGKSTVVRRLREQVPDLEGATAGELVWASPMWIRVNPQ